MALHHGMGMGRGRQHHQGCASGMHRGQGRILCKLKIMDGASQKELVEALGLRAASISEVIERLERDGLVEKRVNDNDKRQANIFLTQAGREAAEKVESQQGEFWNEWLSSLDSGEQEQLSGLLEKLLASQLMARRGNCGHHEHNGHHGCCCHNARAEG